MESIRETNNLIDVICQHTKSGDIIPLRVRLQDEDGQFQNYSVKSYKELSRPQKILSPYGTAINSHFWSFDCIIPVFETMRHLVVFYNSQENQWKITRIY